MEAVKCTSTTESICICVWGFIPTCTCFYSENVFVTFLFVCLFVCLFFACLFLFFRNGKKRGQVGGEAKEIYEL